MKIKIGERIVDGVDEPVMVILSDADKANIAAMTPGATRYCSYPENSDSKEIDRWMEADDDKRAESDPL